LQHRNKRDPRLGPQLLFFWTGCLWRSGPLGNARFPEIVGLSIGVSLAATAVATTISLPIGTALAIFSFRGRRLIVVLINAFFGLPPVVVGLVLYLVLSRSGHLGSLALLFTPTAMVIAQTILAIPIITALVHRASERAWARYGDELITDGATRWQAVPQILMIVRADPQVAWNDFIIVGPSSDPAHIRGGNDSVTALKAIASAQAPFVSRGDRSGTNAAELRLWRMAGRTSESLNPETWYRDIGGGWGKHSTLPAP
jgi:hypothetical protein